MKKPHWHYRTFYKGYRQHQRYLAWLYDSIEPPFDRKRFRKAFRVRQFLYYLLYLPFMILTFVPACIWFLVRPHWQKYDLAVDNFVGGFKRIPQGLWGITTLNLLLLASTGTLKVHALGWSLAAQAGLYSLAVGIIILLFNFSFRCIERCVCNYCADMAEWDND